MKENNIVIDTILNFLPGIGILCLSIAVFLLGRRNRHQDKIIADLNMQIFEYWSDLNALRWKIDSIEDRLNIASFPNHE